MNLPAGANKQVFFLFDDTGDAATNNITISPNAGDTIAGASSLVLNHNGEFVILAYNSGDTDWKIVARSAPLGNIALADLPTITVAKGGTGITSGTSGGIPAFTGSTTIASSGALTANQLIIGGGAGVAPSTLAAGSQYQSLTMGASNPGYSAIALDQSAALSGQLLVANGGTGLASGTSGGVLGYTASGTLASSGALTANQVVIGGGAGATPSSLAAGSQYQSLVMGASNPAYSAVPLNQSAAVSGTLAVANGGTGVTTSTGSTNVVLSNSPTLVTPTLGAATCTTMTFGNSQSTGTALGYFNYASQASTFTFNGTGSPGTSGSVTMLYYRVGDFVTLFLPAVSAITGTTSTTFTANSAVATWARPATTTQAFYGVPMRDNGGSATPGGWCIMQTSGLLQLRLTQSAGAFTNTMSGGTQNAFSFVYYVGTGS
jgi:hypothetical protein